MRLLFLLFIFCICSPGFAQPASAWETIFTGKNLDGWSVVDKPANVSVRDSSMILHMTAHTSRHAFVRTNKTYSDFILELDFRRDRAIDSGVLFRSESAPDTAFSALFGYMVKIDPSPTRRWTGGVLLDFGNGLNWLHPLEGMSAHSRQKKMAANGTGFALKQSATISKCG